MAATLLIVQWNSPAAAGPGETRRLNSTMGHRASKQFSVAAQQSTAGGRAPSIELAHFEAARFAFGAVGAVGRCGEIAAAVVAGRMP